MKNLASLIILTFVFFGITYDSSSQSISGKVTDKSTGESLPFATILIKGSMQGTISNKNGDFYLMIPEGHTNPIIVFSYIGYDMVELQNFKDGSSYQIALTPSLVQLNEVTVRPLKPEEYIKKAVLKFEKNYPPDSFASTSYYREYLKENGDFISMHEGIFASFHPGYFKKTRSQHQLLLYRTVDDPKEIQFMRDKMLKEQAKEKKKAEKKGEEYDEELKSVVNVVFGGPSEVLSSDIVKSPEDCLDSTKFKKFVYKFEPNTTYQGRDIMVISYVSKGTYDHQKHNGKIYIDVDTDSIVKLEYANDLVVPVIAQPILLALGLSVQDPFISRSMTYQRIGDKWYPQTMTTLVKAGITKFHMFKSNEKSFFEAEQILTVNEVKFGEITNIERDKRFDSDKKISEQVYNDRNLSWDDVGRMIPESSK